MTVPARLLLQQGPMLKTVARFALDPLVRAVARRDAVTPGPAELSRVLPPRSPELVEAFVRECGGEPERWRGRVPPHLWPQWGLPVLAEAIGRLDYPASKMLNAGCSLRVRAPLPSGEALHVVARLGEIDADERRAKIRGILTTGTAARPDALEAALDVHIPLSRGGPREKRAPALVPAGAREVARWAIGRRAGLDFALLTGDVNPLHWVRPWALAMGFPNVILHGFASFARTVEALVGRELGGDPDRLGAVEARFTRPLVLPASAALFAGDDGALWVGAAPGEPANLVGRFERA